MRTQVSNKSTGILRKGKRISPEKPLEGDDADAHHGQVDHAQGILASQQARVEETTVGGRV